MLLDENMMLLLLYLYIEAVDVVGREHDVVWLDVQVNYSQLVHEI